MNKNAAKYSQKIGNLVVDFVDYYDAHEQLLQEGDEPWDLDEALEYFSAEKQTSPNETYQMALYLKEKGYLIDPITFHPEYIPEDEKEEIFIEDQFQKHSIFDKYTEALQRKEYERAHQLYESMTPTQKQVIRDRRGHMEKKIKTAQQETEAVLEKEVPVEPITPGLLKELPQQKQQDLAELIEPAEGLVAQHAEMGLPIDSMKVFMPFAHSLDEFKRVRKTEVKKEDLHKRTAVNAAVSQKILALASKLQEKGMSDVAGKLMKTIANDDWLKDEWQEEEPKSTIEQATEIVNQNPLIKFREALKDEKFDIARGIYTLLSPDQRKIADEVSQKHFAIKSLVSLYKIGESLFNSGKTSESEEVSKLVKAQFIDLPKDAQQQVILLIVPQDGMEGLPQAFQNPKGEGLQNRLKEMKQRLMPAKEEVVITPENIPSIAPMGMSSVEAPCSSCGGGCGCSAKTIAQLVKIAGQLEDKGYPQLADKIDEMLRGLGKKPPHKKQPVDPTQIQKEMKDFLKDIDKGRIPAPQTQLKEISPQEIDKAVKRIDPPRSGRDVGTKVCQQCKTPFLYRKDDKVLETHCINCRKMLEKDVWTEGPSGHKTLTTKSTTPVKTACEGDQISGGLSDAKPDDQFDLEEVEKGVKVEMEHTNDKDKAREIAKDHLAENKDYYKKLDIMEKSELKEMEKKEAKKIRPFIRK